MTNYPLIELCIDKIEKMHNKIYTDYAELSRQIKIELDEDISKEDILDYYENYYCCEQEDIKLLYKNIL